MAAISFFWEVVCLTNLKTWRKLSNFENKNNLIYGTFHVVVINTNTQNMSTSKIFQNANIYLFQSIIDMQNCISRVSWCKFLAFCISDFFSWLGSCWTFIFQIWFCVSVELKLNSQIKNMLKFLWLVKFDNQSKNNFEIVHIFPFWRFD